MTRALDQAIAEAQRLSDREQDLPATEMLRIIAEQRERRRQALLERIARDGSRYCGVSEAIDAASAEFRRDFRFDGDKG